MSPLLLLLLHILSIYSTVATLYKTPLCAPGKLEVSGVEAVERNRGRILLTVRCGLQCHDCHKHLREFALMAESISDLSIAILVPDVEHPSAVHHSQLEFPRLQFLHDQGGRTADWPEGQQLLFDRCGRLSKIIQVRPTEPPYHQALEAVRSAVSHAQCGWCQYDTRATRDLSRRQFDAYLSEKRNSQERRDDGNQQRANYQQLRQAEGRQEQLQRREDPRQQPQYNYEQQRPAQHTQQQRSLSYHSQSQPAYQQSQQRQRQQPQYQQSYQQSQQSQQYPQQQQPQQYQPQFPQQHQLQYPPYPQDQRGYHVPSRANEVPADHQQQSSQYQPQQPIDSPSREQRRDNWNDYSTTTSTAAPKPVKKLHYSEDSDYGDYDEVSVATTARTETQIPRPHSPNPFWPTAPPTTMDYRLLMGADVPCAAFTDDICFMQQEKVGKGGQLPKCCSKGIYLTDLCIPGKCSNSTGQLCCLQKFLQAKYACCEDESQSDGTSTTNKFSQCCYSKFVTKDECCTPDRADDYWSTVHELCYPNTKVDLSTVKLEVRFAEGIRVIDLGENRLWDHECKHGANRMQLAFFPS